MVSLRSVGVCAVLVSALCGGTASAAPGGFSVPAFFEPNAGQYPARVRYAARTADYLLTLTQGGAALRFARGGTGLEFSFVGSNPAAEISGAEALRSRTSYFLGSDRTRWLRGVPEYRRVRYGSLYPGVDLVWYTANNFLEYDLNLAPGADPGRIRMRVGGADRLSITSDGDLALETSAGRFIQRKPVLYQSVAGLPGRIEVAGRYRLLGRGVVGFEVGPYDKSRALTIDPVVLYASFFGGSGADSVVAVKVDSAGMIYIVGSINNLGIPGQDGEFQPWFNGFTDIFLAKLDPKLSGADSLIYFTYLGGALDDTPKAMALDAAHNVYITGSTDSPDFPTAGNAFATSLTLDSTSLAGGSDVFVVKIAADWFARDGLYYSTYLGGTGADVGLGIDLDAAGAIYVTGSTSSSDFPATASAYQSVKWGGLDTFIAKIDPASSPSLIYASYLGGEVSDEARSIVVAPNGLVYYAGNTISTQFPLAGASYLSNLPGRMNIFVSAWDLNKSGFDSLVYSGYFGGSATDEVRKIAVDSKGRLLLTGYTSSADFPVTPDAYQRTLNGYADVFVTRLDLNGPNRPVVSYSTFLGGSGDEVAYDIVPVGDQIFVTGYTQSTDFPVTPGAAGLGWSYGGGTAAFIAQLSLGASPSTLAFSTFFGGVGNHVGYGLAVSPNGTMTVAGVTSTDQTPITSNGAQTGYGGGVSDGFLMQVAPDKPLSPADASAPAQ